MSSDVTTDASHVVSMATGGDLAGASRELLERAFNDGNLALVDQLVAHNAVSHDPATPLELRDLGGREVFKRTVAMYRAAFPDVRMIVDDVIATDDKVVLRWHSEGTHQGQLAGFAPTGVRGLVTGISINRWQDGKVVESWVEWDNLGLGRQIGAAPPEGSVGEKIGIGLQRVIARRARHKHQA